MPIQGKNPAFLFIAAWITRLFGPRGCKCSKHLKDCKHSQERYMKDNLEKYNLYIYIYTHTNMYRNNMKQSSTALHKSAWNRFWNHNLHPWRGQVASGWIIVSDPEKVDRLSIMRLFGRETEEAERMERNLWPSSSIQDSGVLWYYFAPHDLDATALKPTFSTVLPLPNNATQYADSLAHESHISQQQWHIGCHCAVVPKWKTLQSSSTRY